MVLGKHLHSCCRSMDEGTGYCHPKICAIPPYGWAQKLGLSRVAQIVAFLQDWCERKKYLREVGMLRTTPKKAGVVSHVPTGRRRTTRPPGPACRSSFFAHLFVFGVCERRHRARHDAARLKKGTKRAPKTRACACFAAAKPPGTTPGGSSSF